MTFFNISLQEMNDMDWNIIDGVVSLVVMVLALSSAALHLWWYRREGRDERGNLINLKATYVMCTTLVYGIAVLIVLDGSLEMTKSLFKLILVSLVGLSMFASAVSLLMYRSRY